MALPVGIIAAVPALTQDFVILSEETQIVGCFVMFVSAIYTQFGDAIAKNLDAQSSAVLAALNKQEDVNVEITKVICQVDSIQYALVELKAFVLHNLPPLT